MSDLSNKAREDRLRDGERHIKLAEDNVHLKREVQELQKGQSRLLDMVQQLLNQRSNVHCLEQGCDEPCPPLMRHDEADNGAASNVSAASADAGASVPNVNGKRPAAGDFDGTEATPRKRTVGASNNSLRIDNNHAPVIVANSATASCTGTSSSASYFCSNKSSAR